MDTTSASVSTDVYSPDFLIAGDSDDIIARNFTLAAGQNYQRGAVLGKITASGKLTLSTGAANDGSQTAYAVLAKDCDASAGDAIGLVYVSGRFTAQALKLGAGQTVANVTEQLRNLSISIVGGLDCLPAN